MTRFVCFLAAALCFAIAPARAQANVAKLITKARAYLGSEETLNSIKSIHYFGTLETEEIVKDKDGKETARPFKGSVEIIFQKPCRQRVELTSDRGTDITVLDDYDGWRRLQPAGSPHWSLTILNPVQVERLRANTWENLAFYRGLERFGGHINDLGPATIDG
ncbi:MAG: hypothetical protein KGJ37_06325, partial [Verrucomicrobiota bacterium]|nr:hypothetical protein [Verrucomicrobiota bacterium]